MLPSIPVSPLIQQSLSCASQLADLTQSSSSSEAAITKHRNLLDQLTQQMYAVRGVLFHQWHPDNLAKQIVAVDAQLFHSSNSNSSERLDDFHQYLMHSLAHQLIITNSYAAFDHAVRLAHALHHYRDWNGLMAVVRCLALPAVQRLSTSSASPLCHDFPWVHHDDATTATTNDTSFAAYRQALRRSLLPLRPYRLDPHDRRRWSDSFKKASSFSSNDQTTNIPTSTSNTSTTTRLVAIPWLPPLVEAESEQDRELLVMLCRSNRWPTQVDVARALLLPSSPPSSPAATTMLFSTSSTSITNNNNNSSSSSSNSSTNSLSANLPPILPPHSITDLLALGPGDLVLQHWLVSRPYLTTEQLGMESQLVESRNITPPPSLPVETSQHQQQQDYNDDQDWRAQTIPYDEEDEDDLMQEDRHDEAVLSVPTSIPLLATATTMDLAQLDQQQQLGNSVMYDGDGDDISDDDDDDDDYPAKDTNDQPATKLETLEQQSTAQSPEQSAIEEPVVEVPVVEVPVVELYAIEEPALDQPALDQPAIEEAVIEEAVIEVPSVQQPALDQPAIEESVIEVPTVQQSALDQPAIEESAIQQPAIQQPAIEEPAIEEPAIEEPSVQHTIVDPPTAEQPPVEQQIVEEATPYPPHNVEIILAPSDDPTTDSDGEQWTGYPGPDQPNDDYDDEIWTGYPEPQQRSTPSEASEEEWKGYHATSEEAKWQAETILKVQQQEWQGYTLETLDEDELDSSTMMNGEFVKSRHARECVTPPFGQPC